MYSEITQILRSVVDETRRLLLLFTFYLRGNGTPPLCDVRPFEINNENDFSLILFVQSLKLFAQLSQLKARLAIPGSRVRTLHRFYILFLFPNFINVFLGQMLQILKILKPQLQLDFRILSISVNIARCPIPP